MREVFSTRIGVAVYAMVLCTRPYGRLLYQILDIILDEISYGLLGRLGGCGPGDAVAYMAYPILERWNYSHWFLKVHKNQRAKTISSNQAAGMWATQLL